MYVKNSERLEAVPARHFSLQALTAKPGFNHQLFENCLVLYAPRIAASTRHHSADLQVARETGLELLASHAARARFCWCQSTASPCTVSSTARPAEML